MKLRAAIILALLSQGAWGATYYVKCDASANGAGTYSDPKNTFAGITTGASDVFRLWPDVVCGADKAMSAAAMIEVGQNDDGVVIELAPEAGKQCDSRTGKGCAILDGGNTIDIGIYGINNDTFVVKDVWARNNEYHNFRHYGTDAQHFSVSLYRTRLEQAGPTDDADVTYSNLSKGDCGFVGRASNGPYRTTVYSDSLTIDTCSRLGFDHRWWVVARHDNYKAFRTGYDRVIGGHGISAHPLSQTYTNPATWSYVSGTCPGSNCVYSMPVVSANDEEQLMWDRDVSPSVRLQRIADGNTNPPEGYFSVVGNATIYFNFGYAPTGGANGVRVNRQPIQVDCYDCEFAYNYVKSDGNLEGSGFHADDTSPMRCFRCYSHDNEGNGFYFNASETDWAGISPRCEDCVAVNNGTSACTGTTCGKGIYVSGGDADIVNSVSVGSLRENFSVAGNHNKCGELKNLVSMNAGLFGLRFQHDATSDCTPEAVYSWNDATAFSGARAAGTVADPKVMGGSGPEAVKPQPDSPLCNAGVNVGARVTEGRRDGVKPAIGRWPCQSWSELP